IQGDYSWNQNSFYAEQIRRFSNTLNLSQNVSLHITPADGIKLTPRISYTHETSRYDGSIKPNEPLSSVVLSAQSQIRFFKNFSVGGAFNQNFNKGYGGGVNGTPTLINLFIENQFFKDRSGVL